MGYTKSLKIWTHESPSTKKEKNDEHMKAHVLKKERKRKKRRKKEKEKDSHVSKH